MIGWVDRPGEGVVVECVDEEVLRVRWWGVWKIRARKDIETSF